MVLLGVAMSIRVAQADPQQDQLRCRLWKAERTLTEHELLDLMVAHPQLLKRPLIIKNGHSTVGFNRGAIEALIEE